MRGEEGGRTLLTFALLICEDFFFFFFLGFGVFFFGKCKVLVFLRV